MVSYNENIPGTNIMFQMTPVPGGMVKLVVESEEGERIDSVTVSTQPFWMGTCEVTWGEYDQFCQLNLALREFKTRRIRKMAAEKEIDAVTAPSELYDPSMYFPKGDKRVWRNYPATGMTQYAAKQYTKWLSKLTGDFYRLPSEAEWEHASRSGRFHAFGFGDDVSLLDKYGWYNRNSDKDTHAVGKKMANDWGLHDMHGNVAEWVLDAFAKNYTGLKQNMANGPAINWPKKLHPRMAKGGSWKSAANNCKSSSRLPSSDDWHNEDSDLPYSPTWLASSVASKQIGFRIARPLKSVGSEGQVRYWDADVDELKKALRVYLGTRSFRGPVDPELPEAIKKLKSGK